jgi:hypothetical protein
MFEDIQKQNRKRYQNIWQLYSQLPEQNMTKQTLDLSEVPRDELEQRIHAQRRIIRQAQKMMASLEEKLRESEDARIALIHQNANLQRGLLECKKVFAQIRVAEKLIADDQNDSETIDPEIKQWLVRNLKLNSRIRNI